MAVSATEKLVKSIIAQIKLINGGTEWNTAIGSNVYWERAQNIEYDRDCTVISTEKPEIKNVNTAFEHNLHIYLHSYVFGLKETDQDNMAIGMMGTRIEADVLTALGRPIPNSTIPRILSVRVVPPSEVDAMGKICLKFTIQLVVDFRTPAWSS